MPKIRVGEGNGVIRYASGNTDGSVKTGGENSVEDEKSLLAQIPRPSLNPRVRKALPDRPLPIALTSGRGLWQGLDSGVCTKRGAK